MYGIIQYLSLFQLSFNYPSLSFADLSTMETLRDYKLYLPFLKNSRSELYMLFNFNEDFPFLEMLAFGHQSVIFSFSISYGELVLRVFVTLVQRKMRKLPLTDTIWLPCFQGLKRKKENGCLSNTFNLG